MRYRFFPVVTALILSLVAATTTTVRSEDLKPEIQEALNAGDTTKAITLLNKEVIADPSYHLNYNELGNIHYVRREWSEAAQQYSLALEQKEKHWPSLLKLGHSQIKLGQFEQAQESMERGLAKAKKLKAEFQNGFGLALMGLTHYDESISYLLQAVNADPDNAQFHIDVGDAYYYMDVPYTAVTEYEKALALDTASTEVYFHWAEACLEMKDFNCAMEKLRVVLSKDSTYAPAWKHAGEIYFKAAMSARTRGDRDGRFKDAIGSYRKYMTLASIEPDSSTVRVFFEMGMAYASINGFEDATDMFEKVLSIPFEPKDIYFYYGKSLTRTRQYAKASETLRKHIDWVTAQDENYKSRIKDWELNQLLGDSYFYREPKDFYTAVGFYKKSLELRPEQKRLIQNVAIGLHTTKSYAEAISYYDQRIAMGIDSATASYIKNAAFCALNLSSSDEDDEMDEMEEDDEGLADDAEPVDYLAMALGYMQQYLEYRPTDTKVVTQLATTYMYSLSDCENGVKWYKRLLELDPSNCEAKKSLGFAYFGGLCTKSFSKALEHLKQANKCLNSGETASDIDIILWIAQAHHLRAVDTKDATVAKVDFKAANKYYGQVLKFDANNTEAKKGFDQTAFEF